MQILGKIVSMEILPDGSFNVELKGKIDSSINVKSLKDLFDTFAIWELKEED